MSRHKIHVDCPSRVGCMVLASIALAAFGGLLEDLAGRGS